MRLLIVINTSAGIGDGSIYDFMRMAASSGDEQCVRYTDGTIDVCDLVDDAAEFDAVVVSGGDGTIASVAYKLAGSGVPILPFPAGTANLLANNLLSPYEPFALARMTNAMQCLDFDLGEIEADGQTFGFGIMAGAGYDATIMHDAQPAKKLWGVAAYFGAAVANVNPQISKIHLTIDGEQIESEGLCVMLVNFSKIQFDIGVTHENEPRDGCFEVIIAKAENAIALIPVLIAGIRDRDGSFPDRTNLLEIHRGREVEVACDPPMQIQYDGEVPGMTTPFKARILDGAARFIVSDAGFEAFS